MLVKGTIVEAATDSGEAVRGVFRPGIAGESPYFDVLDGECDDAIAQAALFEQAQAMLDANAPTAGGAL